MSYVSPFRTIPNILSQPIGIAALISLGLHGALALILPLVPTKSESELQSPQTVEFAELTPAEKSGLPQGYRPEVTLPPFATQQTVLPPQPAVPYAKIVIPPTLVPTYKYPAISSAPNKLDYDVPALQKSADKAPSRVVIPKSKHKYPAISSAPSKLDYDVPALQGSNKRFTPPPRQNVTTQDQQPLPTSNDQENHPSASASSNNSNLFKPIPPPAKPAIPPGPSSSSDSLPSQPETAQQNGSYTYNSTATSEQEGRQNFSDWWIKEVEKANGISQDELEQHLPQDIVVIYQRICPTPSPKVGSIVALVNHQAKVIGGEPKLIKSTGYEFFNKLAQDKVKSFNMSTPQKKYGLYLFRIIVKDKDRNSCIAPRPSANS